MNIQQMLSQSKMEVLAVIALILLLLVVILLIMALRAIEFYFRTTRKFLTLTDPIVMVKQSHSDW